MPAVLALAPMALAEIKPMQISDRKVRDFVAHVFAHGLVFVVEEDGVIVATAGVTAESPWWSDEIGIDTVWLYVVPERRRTPHASALLRAVKLFGDRSGFPVHAAFAAAPGDERRFNAMRSLYERVFGRPAGMSFYLAPTRGGNA
jgi:GNAT superfamily N-acetyltransferase